MEASTASRSGSVRWVWDLEGGVSGEGRRLLLWLRRWDEAVVER